MLLESNEFKPPNQHAENIGSTAISDLKCWAKPMKQFLILIVLWTAGGVFAAEDAAALKLRIDALEKDVAALKAENAKLREGLAAQQSEYSKQVYVKHVVPLVRPMLKDFGMDESLIVPVDKIENLADAYRPLLMMVQKLGAVADLGPPTGK